MKKRDVKIVVDCGTCAHGGEEKNYICFCSVLGVGRAVGVRRCVHYKHK